MVGYCETIVEVRLSPNSDKQSDEVYDWQVLQDV